MHAWFADTYYFLALRNPRDEGRGKAVAATAKLAPYRLVTTAWILTEVADALAKPVNRPGFARLIEMLGADPSVLILPPTQSVLDQGISLYNARPDKEWSLTDCISFVVMTAHGITEALTGDQHFEQAGFVALLK